MNNKKIDNFLASLRQTYTSDEGKILVGKVAGHAAAIAFAVFILVTVVGKIFRFTVDTLAALGADNFTTIVTAICILAICSLFSKLKQVKPPQTVENAESFLAIRRELQQIFYRIYQESRSIPLFALRDQLDPLSIPITLQPDECSVLIELNKQLAPVGEAERMAFLSFLQSKIESLGAEKAAFFRGFNIRPQVLGIEDGGPVWRIWVRLQ